MPICKSLAVPFLFAFVLAPLPVAAQVDGVPIVRPAGREPSIALGGLLQVQGEFGERGDARFSSANDRFQLRVPSRLQLATRFETFDPDRSKDHDRADNYVLGLTNFIKGEDIKMLVDWFHTVPEETASGEAETQDKLVVRMQTVF